MPRTLMYVSSAVNTILIDKRFNADGGSLAVVGDLLVGDTDVVKVFQSL